MIANIFCLIYYTIATIQNLPCIYRIYKRKSSTDISIVSTILCFISITSWSAYVFMSEQSTIVYIGTVWDWLVDVVYTIVVFLYHDNVKRVIHKDK